MKFNREKFSDCKNCPLRDQNRVWGEGVEDSKILLLGEAPGRDEDYEKRPFVGQAGRYLNWGLSQAKILRYRIWVTNIIACRPPNNNLTLPESLEAIECCRKGFEAELKFLKSLKVITPLGKKPMNYLNIDGKITENRGSCYHYKNILTIPTFHPSYLARGEDRIQKKTSDGKVNVSYKYVWIADLKKVKHFSITQYEKPVENFNIFPTLEDVYQWIHHATANKLQVDVDIETVGKDHENGEIVVIGLTIPNSGLSVPFYSQHRKPYWNEDDLPIVKDLLDQLFSTCPLTFQNALFDARWLRAKDYNLPFENIKHDSMLLFHIISPELPKNLGFINSLYGKTPYWKAVFKEKEGSIFDLTDEKVRIYNLRDANVLNQMLPHLEKDAREMGTYHIYENESMKLIKPFMKMMNNGFKLNVRRLKKWVKDVEERKVILENMVFEIVKLPTQFNLSSDDDLRYLLFGIVPNKLKNIEETFLKREKKSKSLIKSLEKKLSEINNKETKKYSTLLKRYKQAVKGDQTKIFSDLKDLINLKNKTPILWNSAGASKTKSGKLSVDDQGRLSLLRKVQNRLESISHFKNPTPTHKQEVKNGNLIIKFMSSYNKWKSYDKLLSTYSHYKLDFDSRVHTHLLIHGTATGRPSSKDPNLLNIPKELSKDEPDIRKCFVASPGMKLLSADYKQLEIVLLAYATGDEKLIHMITNNIDIHGMNCYDLFNIKEGNSLFKLGRNVAKIFQFALISYGGTLKGIFEKITTKIPEFGLTFKKFKEASENYFNAHPAIKIYQDNIRQQVELTRTVETAFGRKRVFMGEMSNVLREAINTPIQGTAAHITNKVTIDLDNEMEKRNLKSRLLLQIYDQLIVESPIAEIDEMSELLTSTMEQPFQLWGNEISFKTDLKTGPSWGELTEK